MIRKCTKCQEEKDISLFPKKGETMSGKQLYKYRCKVCDYQRLKARIKKPSVRKLPKVPKWTWFINLKKSLSCVDCGLEFKDQHWCLDFHHLDPNAKEYSVGHMVKLGKSREVILEEISKCVPLCANCHRTRHQYEKVVHEFHSLPD